MRSSFVIAAASIAAVIVSCGQPKQPQTLVRTFPKVQIPAMVTDPQEKMEYMGQHYWDAFVDTTGRYVTDSTHIAGILRGDVEQAVANYVPLMKALPIDRMRKSVFAFCDRISMFERHDAADSTFEAVVRIFDRYLYDPNSPVRNEEIYLPFCEKMAVNPYVDITMQGKYAFEAGRCSLNRIGTVAADFKFTDRYGKVRNLHGIKAETTLLFFSNPGCHACKGIIDQLVSVGQIGEMISDGRLAVVNVYVDEDLEAWMGYMPIYPSEWYNGYDQDLLIRTDELYSLRAIPSLYILDSEKRVVLKDAVENEVFDYLLNMYERR